MFTKKTRIARVRISRISSPASVSAKLARLLSPSTTQAHEHAPEILSAYYSNELSIAQREIFRQALLMTLNRFAIAAESKGVARVLDAMRAVDILIPDEYIESKLWSIAYRAHRASDKNFEHTKCAVFILAFIAEKGSLKSASHWEAVLDDFGVESAFACADGIARLGPLEFLAWMDRSNYGAVRSELLRVFLPKFVRADAPSIKYYIRYRASPRFKQELDRVLSDLQLSLTGGASDAYLLAPLTAGARSEDVSKSIAELSRSLYESTSENEVLDYLEDIESATLGVPFEVYAMTERNDG